MTNLADAYASVRTRSYTSIPRLTYTYSLVRTMAPFRQWAIRASPTGNFDDSSNRRRGEGPQTGNVGDAPPNPLLERNNAFSEPFRQRTRLADALLAMPSKLDNYFEGGPGPYRRVVWLCIAFLAGYYSANVVSLSFGTLAINDVVAAVVTVGFCEVVSYAYWSADRPGFQVVLTQAFKMGVTAALITDALKLQA